MILSVRAEVQQYDVVVYGGTSAAVTAAVEVARMGKSVVIVSPDHHLGGMTSNGLGWTDIGERDTIGGLSREFYNNIYNHYLDASAWTTETRQQYVNRSGLDPDTGRQMMFTFEPKVARQIFENMVAEANVPVVAGRLDRSANGISMAGNQIQSFKTEAGVTFQGKAFIDATYEGDLLAAAGVSYVVGRESNAQFGEKLNGIQTQRATKNQLPGGIDPYVVPGNPSSGLLPGVNATAGGSDGTADKRLQAYNYRMVLTNNPANRVPVPQPANYDEANYEILFRAIEAGQTQDFYKYDPMPNNKTDSNNRNGISTDYIGGNYDLETGWNYAEADYASREEMLQAHVDYQMGLVWTLQNHPRVPQAIRNSTSNWGLPADEFTDNGNWPNQIYVREARRMVGDVVINENHVNQLPGYEFADSIGMGGYNMDSHHVQRHVGIDGKVINEGDVQVPPQNGPYPLSYRAIVPQRGEAENLLVPVAVSATHIAYGSLRMEPVFMALGQSAGAAAAIVAGRELPVQDLPYGLLRSRLVRENQILGVSYTSPDPGILLSFGTQVGNGTISPGHTLGGVPGATWNVVAGDLSSGIVDSLGGNTPVSVNLGKSAGGQQLIDWEATGFGTANGSAVNTGIYVGNARSALFVNDGANSQVDLGIRISGLEEGIYDSFLTAKNTNTIAGEDFNIYTFVVDADSGSSSYTDVPPQLLAHDTSSSWQFGDNFVAETFEVVGEQDLVIVVEGISANELRGFLNTLEIVKLAGPMSADLNRDGAVNIDDFHFLREHFNTAVPLGTNGDANSDGLVDLKDFYFWRRLFVTQGGDLRDLEAAIVPEPATAACMLIVSPLLMGIRMPMWCGNRVLLKPLVLNEVSTRPAGS
jgi:hypothetical protein